jgi:hypothetical protein
MGVVKHLKGYLIDEGGHLAGDLLWDTIEVVGSGLKQGPEDRSGVPFIPQPSKCAQVSCNAINVPAQS